jgi:hypothetical protein
MSWFFNTCDSNMHGERIKKKSSYSTLYKHNQLSTATVIKTLSDEHDRVVVIFLLCTDKVPPIISTLKL